MALRNRREARNSALAAPSAVVVAALRAPVPPAAVEWDLAVRYLPSIDSNHLRRWLGAARAAGGESTVGMVIPTELWACSGRREEYREICVPAWEYAEFAAVVTPHPEASLRPTGTG
ncbi:hypothetical protein JMUB6875_14150 [Nocardia sp. JMUB6875]|uniref:hypothetical protein n=1 Tax=Nocardia TaxID=1817 RepID=UPI0002F08A92|nr:hypothetical protein [Nocardia concava]